MTDTFETWDDARCFALGLPGTEPGTNYGMPSVQVAANARSFIHSGGEPDTSFVVLVRYGASDQGRARAVISQAREQAAGKKPVRRK